MNYWLTIHWPHRVDDEPLTPQGGVWVKDKKEADILEMEIGDLVFIYESKYGTTAIEENTDGSIDVPCKVGRAGIVSLVEVTHRPKSLGTEINPENQWKYRDGRVIWWRWHAQTKPVNTTGFIPRRQFNEIMNFKPGCHLRSSHLGKKRSGLSKITWPSLK